MARVACIGAGNVGSAWAVVFARAGHDVTIFDADPSAVQTVALPRIDRALETLDAAMPTGETIAVTRKRIDVASEISDAVSGADHVQESVREDVTIKRDVFAQIAAFAPPTSILASSTSALPGSTFLMDIEGPERALVAHPVNPPSHIPLVELCPTPATSQQTLDRAKDLLVEARMKPIVLRKEVDGFILNRLQYTLVAEAMHLIGEGYLHGAGH